MVMEALWCHTMETTGSVKHEKDVIRFLFWRLTNKKGLARRTF